MRCHPDRNFKRLCRDYNGLVVDESYEKFARLQMPVHGTTIERLATILADRTVYSHRKLREVHLQIVEDRLKNATDELDIALGLDQYVFLSVGRVHLGDIQPV